MTDTDNSPNPQPPSEICWQLQLLGQPKLVEPSTGRSIVLRAKDAALLAVIASLFSALYYLYRDRGHGTRMLKMLALRVALSASLVVFLVVSYKMGWIAPTGLR